MSMESMTNAPLEIKLKGDLYKVSEYTLKDLANFRRKIQSNKIKLVSIVEDKEDRMALTREILKDGISDDEFLNEMQTVEGVSYLLWCMIKPNQEIELEAVERLVDADSMGEIITVMTNLSPVKDKKKVKEQK